MKFTRLKAVGIAAAVAGLAFVGAPANAAAPPVTDPSGVDFDAGCLVGNPTAPVGSGNNVPSPGTNSNCLVGTYDGGTESTDLRSVDLKKDADGLLSATFAVDGSIPAAGSTVAPALGAADLPNNTFVGLGYKAMFQNPALQNNTPYVAGTRIGTGTPIYGLNEHWRDGFHFFLGFDAVWDGAKWIHSAQIGTYDSGPDGAFFFDELGTNSGAGWVDADPICFAASAGGGATVNWGVTVSAGTVTVKSKGTVKVSSSVAVGGCVEVWYAKPGNNITNVKGWSTANATVTLPVTVPLSVVPGFSDITSVGGFIFSSDMTEGNSRNFGTGATLATASGDNPLTTCTNEGLLGNRPCVSSTGGLIGATDTLGDGPRCWTSTFGGIVPANPLWVTDQPCYIDDDNVPGPSGNSDPGERGTFLSEFWDTNYGFTF